MSRGTDALAEAKAVAGPETLAAEYQEAKREARERDESGVKERGDGMPVGSPPPEVL
ncbi:hypothetical protein [Natrialba aegyptia]|uniref:hypothetical protein n=1 Tax=Natrialba aegyptia TaxID=129789 RepID=UPI0013762F8E|nr:hypothetical protein [Natrialba aegyptia]